MKNYLRSAALLFIGLSAAIPVLAACPDGKSEVLLMTPSGITKTICVSDNAIPGIENAAEHNGGFTLEPECPCLDVWDGFPYPVGTVEELVDPSYPLPVLPDKFADGQTCYLRNDSDTYRLNFDDGELQAEAFISYYYENRHQCAMTNKISENTAWVKVSDESLFSDVDVSSDPISSLMMDACKTLLEERGCVFVTY